MSNYSIFESEITIRPDDIDLNNHVHNSKYLDYVMAARYEQMIKDYKMPMNDFFDLGYNWVVSSVQINYKRALKLDDKIIVRTQLDFFEGAQCKVNFWIVFKNTSSISADGHFIYTMISKDKLKPVRIPEDIIAKYTI